MTTFVKSYGISQSYVLKNNKNNKNNKNKTIKSFKKIKWNGNYDGNNAHLDIDMNDNGKTEHLNMILNNNDLMQLFNMQSVDIPIHERLQNDFLLKESSPNISISKKILTKSKSKSKSKSKQNSSKSRKMQKFLSLKTL
jgi:hypothetical protein